MQSKNTRVKIVIVFLTIVSVLFGLNYGGIINVGTLFKSSTKASNDSYVRIADPNTMDSYQDFLLNSTNGSRYAGRIWADKSVFAKNNGNGTLALDMNTDGINKELSYNSDFLNIYSALGSSQNTIKQEALPLDVVLLLDMSTSMTTKGGAKLDKADQVIEQANKFISKLMNVDDDPNIHKNNRVGVVVYAGGSEVVLPLNHYSLIDNNNAFLSISYQHINDKYWPQVSTHVKLTDKSFSNVTSDILYADSTYLQGAIYQGMNMLSSETETTYTDSKTARTSNRIPVLIALTDGGTNAVGATQTPGSEISIDWWDPVSWVSSGDGNTKALLPTPTTDLSNWKTFIPVPNGNPIYISLSARPSNGVDARTLSNLLTAGFMKKKVEANYNQHTSDADYINFKVYGLGFDVADLSVAEKKQINLTMNPREYFVDNSGDAEIQRAYDTFMSYLNHEDPTLTFGGYSWINEDISASWTFKHPPGDLAKYDVTSLEDMYYIDEFIESDSNSVGTIFDGILEDMLVSSSVGKPIDGENDSGVSNSITYKDPIGKYMSIKDNAISIDNKSYDMGLLLFGKIHNIKKYAVYDYTFNSTHRGENHDSDDMRQPLKAII